MPQIPAPMLHTRLLLLLTLAQAGRLAAQTASPYVPLQYWGMPYVEHLIAAGVMADPTPLTRPLRRADLVRALHDVDTLTTGRPVKETVRRLLAALESPASGPHYRLDADLGVSAATYARRDPLSGVDSSGPRQAGPGHTFVSSGLAVELDIGGAVAVTHPYFDTRLKYDPDWYGKKDRQIAGRTAESYISAQWRLAEIFFGRMDRNWGPSDVQGLLLSDNPYGLDHLGLMLGTRRVQLQAVVTQLDTRTDSTGAAQNRYMVQHRLLARPSHRWSVALWEGSVLSGRDRQLEPWYLNILNVGYLEQLNSGTNVNSFVGLDFERHSPVTVFGQFMLDDIQVDHRTPHDLKPSSYGLTVGATSGLWLAPATWRLYYTRVTNLTYRNEDNLQVPLYHLLGTGRNFDDYDQATLRVSIIPVPGLLLEPELTVLRQGEGDPRLPHPAEAQFPTTPTIFQGVVERTLRGALGGSYAPDARLGLRWDAGVHRIANYQHVTGAHRTRPVASIALTYRLRKESALP